MSPNDPPKLLPGREWQVKYESDDGNLVELFYNPALERAVRYDRTTGYFSAGALALAARGITQLCSNEGRMRLVVGCTLNPPELEAIERGYDLRKQVHESLERVDLAPPTESAREGLEMLAWLIEHGRLDLRVAVPVGPNGKPMRAEGIYHEKVGIIEDAAGNKLTFSGSNNETAQGWQANVEGFHVHCTWRADGDHAREEIERFEQLWNNEKQSVKVFDFPEAVKQRLLEFLPQDDRRVTPALPPDPPPEPGFRLTPEEVRRIVWTYIAHAAQMWNGIRVGEVTSAVEPWPHQLRNYVDFIQGWPSRLLVADEVGLGKTITAGLILRQAWLSKKAKRILVLVPRAVIQQWQNELYEKFNLNVPIYDGSKLQWREAHGRQAPLEKAAGRKDWHREPFVLCSSQLARRSDRAADLLEAERWDLIVLDEAHHARRRGGVNRDRNEPNALLRLMRSLRDEADSLLLLTATPMQVHPVEVYDLLDLLGLPDGWSSSWQDFLRYFEQAGGNPSETELEFLAQMFQATESAYGETSEEAVALAMPNLSSMDCRRVLKALRDSSGIPRKKLDTRRRAAAREVLLKFSPMRFLMARQTRDLLRVYHERGLLASPIAERDVRDIAVDMTAAETRLYESVEDYISTTYNNAAENKKTAVGFVMTTYRRRLASSFHALRQTLNGRLARVGGPSEEDLTLDETRDDVMDAEEGANLYRDALDVEERGSIEGILKQIAKCDGGREGKAKRLLEELQTAFADGYDSAIVFTQYADTMDSLKEFLATELPDWPIATYSGRGGSRLMHGGQWASCSKEQVKLDLRDGRVKLLVCTDAAGEGLNLQSCGVLANYDLPWNPMKVEQRIGRIDRIGQKYAPGQIRILNFAYKGTVEEDVYFSLGTRINLFRKIVGKLQPILSKLPRRFEEVSLKRPEERQAAKQRLLSDLDNERRVAEQSAFDIDFGAEEIAAPPDLPEPAVTLDQIEEAMRPEAVHPPGLEWQLLDPGSYAAAIPGMPDRIRVTTRAQVFDDHVDSHQFFSPGGELFEAVQRSAAPTNPEADLGEGVCWLLRVGDGLHLHLLVGTGLSEVWALSGLAACLDSVGEAQELSHAGLPGEQALRVV